jgi:hypothetical protein
MTFVMTFVMTSFFAFLSIPSTSIDLSCLNCRPCGSISLRRFMQRINKHKCNPISLCKMVGHVEQYEFPDSGFRIPDSGFRNSIDREWRVSFRCECANFCLFVNANRECD